MQSGIMLSLFHEKNIQKSFQTSKIVALVLLQAAWEALVFLIYRKV